MKKLSLYAILCVATLLSFGGSLAQTSIFKNKYAAKNQKNYPISIGFQSGRELLFNSSPLLHSRQSKVHYNVSNRLVLRKPLSTHLKIEAGLNYSIAQPYTKRGVNTLPIAHPLCNYSLPLTAQYYFIKEKCRFQPYIGTGFQYSIFNAKPDISLFKSDNTTTNYQSGTKYISLLFTQGITFAINTNIDVEQSLHFIPCNGTKVLGIDLGITYKLP